MSWYSLALCSAFFLGLYELAKKAAIRGNSIGAVLFWSVVAGAVPWLPITIISHWAPDWLAWPLLRVDAMTWEQHMQLVIKSSLAASSWGFTYAALRQLPISIAGPIRATSPLWTILAATLIFGERPSFWQWLGITVISVSFYAITCVGRWEGIDWRRDRHVGYMLIATLLASGSALYDKYLLQQQALSVATVQAWFSLYLVPLALPSYLIYHRRKTSGGHPFVWRWSVPAVGGLLLITDFLYFSAVSQPGAMISLISPLRRTSVLVSTVAGAHLFRERYLLAKLVCLAGLLGGVLLVSRSAH